LGNPWYCGDHKRSRRRAWQGCQVHRSPAGPPEDIVECLEAVTQALMDSTTLWKAAVWRFWLWIPWRELYMLAFRVARASGPGAALEADVISIKGDISLLQLHAQVQAVACVARRVYLYLYQRNVAFDGGHISFETCDPKLLQLGMRHATVFEDSFGRPFFNNMFAIASAGAEAGGWTSTFRHFCKMRAGSGPRSPRGNLCDLSGLGTLTDLQYDKLPLQP
jgi:hypothetical protein